MTTLPAATFLLLPLLCQVFATEGSGCEPPSGYVTFPEYNAAFKIDEEIVRWPEARDRCIAEGAHLAVITTAEQIKQIVNSTLLNSKFFLHIGVHRSSITSPWVRVDNGLPVTFSAMYDEGESNCVTIWRGNGGSFVDSECGFRCGFVCETSLAEGCSSPIGHQDSQSLPDLK